MSQNGKNPTPSSTSQASETYLVSARNKVVARLLDEYGRLPTRTNKGRNGRAGGWRVLAARYGVPAATVYRVAMRGYYPHNAAHCRALGLPELAQVACCPSCGRPPLRKRCACRDGAAKRRRLPPPLVRLVAGLLAAGKLEVRE